MGEARWLGHLDANGAEAAYREAVRVDPQHVWSYLGLASLFLTLHAPEKALPWIDLAERYAGAGEQDRPAVLRGEALFELGRYADALVVLRQAQQAGPQNGWAAYFMGQVFEAQGDMIAALAAYQRAAQLLPDDRGVGAALTKAISGQASPRSPH
jgi:tetratricopeptide (TPR) repeat protein